MRIKKEISNNAARFIVEKEKTILAQMDFELRDNNILLITHTIVSDALKGKGVGKQLVSAAVDYSREKSLTIKSECSFAKAVLDKTPEYADVYHAKK